jgi:TonB family protein
MRDAPFIRIVMVLLVGTVCAVDCSRDKRGARPDLDNELVHRTIGRCSPQVRACYNAELIDNPGLEGRINVRFTVGREGRVTTAAVGASTLRNPTLETCLVDVVKLCSFAKPRDRRPVDLSYTFEFGPSKSNDGT